MATSAPTASQAELISSLSQDDIPIKLRCAICSRLAVNAFRLPCCEQAICETCQSKLPSSCPVCEHTPLAADDCKPHKSLRTTIKVFLRTEEKKREALRIKDFKDTPPIAPGTPVEIVDSTVVQPDPIPTPATEIKVEVTEPSTVDVSTITKGPERSAVSGGDVESPLDAQQDVPQQSIEEIAPGQEQTEDGTPNVEYGNMNAMGQSEQMGLGEKDQNGQELAPNTLQTPGFGMGFGFDAANGGFPNLGMMGQGGDLNQMQMMMAMQNGMAPNAFGTFPMMGMPGMTMDPMAMQAMYMNGGYGAQGMGMNGMNIGLGMGFDGGMGTGFNNGWNGQQSWNVGQDNFNHPNATGIGHGDFGANNNGFHTGYNQGNYGRASQYNDYQQNGYAQGQYSRGRGRGRGYQNRGGYGYGHHDSFSHLNSQQLQNGSAHSDMGSIPTGPKADAVASAPPVRNVDEYGRELREKTEAKVSAEPTEPTAATEDAKTALDSEDVSETTLVQNEQAEKPDLQQDDTPKPIQTLEQAAYSSVPGHYNGYNDFTGYGSMQPPDVPFKVVDIPLNAPTGPKAMREGLPNTSIKHLRARGISNPVQNGHMQEKSHTEASKTLVKSRSGTPELDGEQDRSRSRSRSHDRRHKRRQRSASLSDDAKEEERRRERRKRHSRKYEEETDDVEADNVDDSSKEKANGEPDGRTRSQSPTESRRSSHRSRRDRDKERDRGRDYDREKDRDGDRKSSSHKHRSSHRSHRDRERSRERDRDVHRAERNERDRSRERRHRHRHDSEEPPKGRADSALPSAATDKPPINIPSGPRSMTVSNSFSAIPTNSNGKATGIEINIRGASRNQSVQTPELDSVPTSHTDDRKDRNRERERERDRSSRHREERERERERHPSRDGRKIDVSVKIPTGPSAASNKGPSKPTSSKSAVDPHTLDREARNRERLLKEAQRMAGLNALISGTAGRKRSLDEGVTDGDAARRRTRKSRVKSSNERWEDGVEGEEARIARLESEREGGRWG